MKEIVVVGGVRTPIGNFGGALRNVSVVDLGSRVISEVLIRNGVRPIPPKENVMFKPKLLDDGATELETRFNIWNDSLKEVTVDEVIMGTVLPAGQGQNVARQAMIYGGLPKETNAFSVNKACASGLKAISLGAQAITSGASEVIIAGGMENMSNVPYALPRARWGYGMNVSGTAEMQDLLILDGLFESFYGYHLGVTAENIAEKYGITRQEQDDLGFLSHQRACSAIRECKFKEEILPVRINEKKSERIFETDERPIEPSLEKMSKLQPVFKKHGTVTAGNASGINDGAAAVLLMEEEKCTQFGLRPLARILGFASGAVDPAYMGLGPIPAVNRALKISGISIDEINLIELNEAFASQAIACIRELGISLDRTNIHGSGISLGHPIGCTGARIIVSLLFAMKQNNAKYGLATLCVGGGQGMAMIFELAS